MWFMVGGAVAFIVACCFAANGVTWWRGRAEHLEKTICILAKSYPCKVWDALPPYVRDECMKIVEKHFNREIE